MQHRIISTFLSLISISFFFLFLITNEIAEARLLWIPHEKRSNENIFKDANNQKVIDIFIMYT